MLGATRISCFIVFLTLFSAGSAVLGCPVGDLNGDCRVSWDDLELFAAQWLDPSGCGGSDCADFDRVNGVDMADYSRLAENWGVEEIQLVISEFMARNSDTLLDKDGDSSDWIEIYNPTGETVDLDGWYLTDNDANLAKWRLPSVELEPGQFVVVFASDKDVLDANELHTSFKLEGNGEYLALVAPDGNTIVHEYAPEYPEQLSDISYGLTQYAVTLVPSGATATYHVPTVGDEGLDWTAVGFDDSGWDTGKTALGFGTTVVEAGQDIGTPSAAGSHQVNNGVYTVIGDGEDIWGDTDDFYYAYASLTGDGELTARVTSVENTNEWAKAGVMIREELTDTSSHAMMIVTPSSRYGFQWVNGPVRDQSVHTDPGVATWPAWVRIVRQGNTFTGYYSADGVNWTMQGTEEIEMASDVYIGLCVTSHSDGVLCTAVFDNVSGSSSVASDVQEKMLGINSSLWARIAFDLEEGERDIVDTLELRMKYEDGFVAYLNGQEIARRNASDPLQWNSTSDSNRPIEESLVFEPINVMPYLHLLQTGENVLAIHGLNDDRDSDEFLILPELEGASNVSIPQYFTTPTPGTFNVAGGMGFVSEVWFSHKRGFYDTAFDLTLSTEMDDAEIRYTTDGSRPTITHGNVYNSPFTVSYTSCIRAVATKPGWLDSDVETRTYIFVNDVIGQSPMGQPPGPNWPSGTVNGQVLDYGMDPYVVVYDPRYVNLVDDALLSIPTISMVTDLDNLFHPSKGIYVNAGMEGRAWERPVSVELLYPPDPQGAGFPDLVEVPDGQGGTRWELPADMRDGFQIDAGMRIRGGWSVSGDNPKHAFRLFFRTEYGEAKLRYPLFSDEGVDEFDHIDLRTSQNYSWAFVNSNANTLVRDVWSRDVQGQMGHAYTRSRYYHLYLNGHYWGLFQTQERSEATFGQTYFGGEKEDYDAISSNWSAGRRMVPTDGTRDSLDRLYDETMLGLGNYERYYRIQGQKMDGTPNDTYERLLDVEGLIDFMIIEYYSGDRDGPGSRFGGIPNNTWCIYNRVNPDGFKWFHHDNEHTLGAGVAEENMVTPFTTAGAQRDYFNPHWLHEQLMFVNSDYRIKFADHAYKHFFNGGLLTTDAVRNEIIKRKDQIDMAIIAHSARWGDAKRITPYTKDDDWLPEINRLLYNSTDNRYVTLRKGVVLSQFDSVGWYPNVEPPTLTPYGGEVLKGSSVTMSAPSGTIYYTLDGSDPRLSAATSAPGPAVTLVAEDAAKRVLVPTGPVAAGTGTITAEYWMGIQGTAVADLTSHPDYPNSPSDREQLTSLETPTDWAEHYGARVRGWVHPPTTGSWTFWIASDDNGELWLSTDEDPANKVLVAHVPGWTTSRQWAKYAQQQSASVSLTAGQKYYIEALMKEHEGGDNLAVTWEGPGIFHGNPIAGQYLSPAGDVWAMVEFDDSSWTSGTGGVGYERNPTDPVNYVEFIDIDVEAQMYNGNTTCYIRIPFTFSGETGDFNLLTLKIRYDDAFVAYLNGTEVTRRNFDEAPHWNSAASAQHDDSAAVQFENIDISDYLDLLRQGDNVLAIQGLNISNTSSDFLISAELEARQVSIGDVSPLASEYLGPITLNESTHVKARVLDNKWSPLSEATFGIGPIVDNLRITEIMYHPKFTGDPNDPNEEFVELKNIGGTSINLSLVRFTEGIRFTFPSLELGAGEYVVVVSNRNAFEAEYGSGMTIGGECSGRLANNGERIRLEDALGRTILDFRYRDGWRPHTDGDGFSLTIIDPANADTNSWDEKDGWRASAYAGGSPGSDDSGIIPNPGAIVINEVMAHSHLLSDWIELHNTTGSQVDIGGWYLSDNGSDDANLMKYRIANGTKINANDYIVFYEDNDFANPGDPGCNEAFALSENGEEIRLSSGEGGALTGYRENEDFGASETNVSFGRYFKPSTGNYNFVFLDSNTPRAANAGPKVGPIVINEIMYNPISGNQNEEYVELLNITGLPVVLYDYVEGAPWKFTDGIDYTFPSDSPIEIPAYGYLLVVKNPTAFAAKYGSMPQGLETLGPYDGLLSNAGETLEIGKPGDVDGTGRRYYIRVDRVKYSDGKHPENCPGNVDLWPTEPDGGGKALKRKVPTDYGNDVINWDANEPLDFPPPPP